MGEQNADDLIQFRINKRLEMEGITPTHRLFATKSISEIPVIGDTNLSNDFFLPNF